MHAASVQAARKNRHYRQSVEFQNRNGFNTEFFAAIGEVPGAFHDRFLQLIKEIAAHKASLLGAIETKTQAYLRMIRHLSYAQRIGVAHVYANHALRSRSARNMLPENRPRLNARRRPAD